MDDKRAAALEKVQEAKEQRHLKKAMAKSTRLADLGKQNMKELRMHQFGIDERGRKGDFAQVYNYRKLRQKNATDTSDGPLSRRRAQREYDSQHADRLKELAAEEAKYKEQHAAEIAALVHAAHDDAELDVKRLDNARRLREMREKQEADKAREKVQKRQSIRKRANKGVEAAEGSKMAEAQERERKQEELRAGHDQKGVAEKRHWSGAGEFGSGLQAKAREKLQKAEALEQTRTAIKDAAQLEQSRLARRAELGANLGLNLGGSGTHAEDDSAAKLHRMQGQEKDDLANGILRRKLPTGEVLIQYNVDTADELAKRKETARTKFPLRVSEADMPAAMRQKLLDKWCRSDEQDASERVHLGGNTQLPSIGPGAELAAARAAALYEEEQARRRKHRYHLHAPNLDGSRKLMCYGGTGKRGEADALEEDAPYASSLRSRRYLTKAGTGHAGAAAREAERAALEEQRRSAEESRSRKVPLLETLAQKRERLSTEAKREVKLERKRMEQEARDAARLLEHGDVDEQTWRGATDAGLEELSMLQEEAEDGEAALDTALMAARQDFEAEAKLTASNPIRNLARRGKWLVDAMTGAARGGISAALSGAAKAHHAKQRRAAELEHDNELLGGARLGDAIAVRRALFAGANLAHRGELDGRSALHHAAECGHLAVAELLLAQQLGKPAHLVDVRNLSDRDISRQWCPLHEAVWNDRGAIVRLLLEHGAKVDVVDAFGTTPLMMAVVKNNMALMKTLIADGKASLGAVDNDGRTPLHHAAARGTLDTIRLLLHVGASIEARDNVGHSPPDYAMISKRRRAYEVLRITRNEIDPADVLRFYFQKECASAEAAELQEKADEAQASLVAAEEEAAVAAGVDQRGRRRVPAAAVYQSTVPSEGTTVPEVGAERTPAEPNADAASDGAGAVDDSTADDGTAEPSATQPLSCTADMHPAGETSVTAVLGPDWLMWARRLKIRGSQRRLLFASSYTNRFKIVLNALIEDFERGGNRADVDAFRAEMQLPKMPLRIKVPRTVHCRTIDDFTSKQALRIR
jgi:hypothetical protein